MNTLIVTLCFCSLVVNIATLCFVVMELRARKIKAINQAAINKRMAALTRRAKTQVPA
jgi:hypothetical protein